MWGGRTFEAITLFFDLFHVEHSTVLHNLQLSYAPTFHVERWGVG